MDKDRTSSTHRNSPDQKQKSRLLLGIDIGGTFTDFVLFWPSDGRLETFKLLSTPGDPAEAVLRGIVKTLEDVQSRQSDPNNNPRLDISIVHGSTVATNALLERKGAVMALITTHGFRDVLQIGRQNRPSLYDLNFSLPKPLLPEELCLEVEERVDAGGQIIQPLDVQDVNRLLPTLENAKVESVAVCLLFSFLKPEHENLIGDRLRAAGYSVSLSSDILPEYREYERFSTTAVNAFVSPVMDRYLTSLELALPDFGAGHIPLRVMQSNGGVISPDEARKAAVRCILSGPAGGVTACEYISQLASGQISPAREGNVDHLDERSGLSKLKLITFDMGGTSTDVSLIDGSPNLTTEAVVGGCPIRIPVLDIHTIGAGGGSITALDPGGALRVGPQSAGAFPGPACYARAPLEECLPTVTDANLVLGRLLPDRFLGGEMPLDAARAYEVLRRLGSQMGLDPVRAALGVIEVASAHMERALRLISVERGYDPRDFVLLSFGGAGGLHAVELARRLGIPRVLVPPIASTLSAFGMLTADVIRDYSQTVMLFSNSPVDSLEAVFDRMEEQGWKDLSAEGFSRTEIEIQRSLDLRYRGQSYELNVPLSWCNNDSSGNSLTYCIQRAIDDFHLVHQKTYGYSLPEAQIEIVTARLRAVGKVVHPNLVPSPLSNPDPESARIGDQLVHLQEGQRSVPCYSGEALKPGNRFSGPALVVRPDTTILIGPQDRAQIDPYRNLIITVGEYIR